MTKAVNLLYAIVCAIAALGTETGTLPIPEKWRHYVTGAALFSMWLKSHWNLFINPDSTHCSVAYKSPAEQAIQPSMPHPQQEEQWHP